MYTHAFINRLNLEMFKAADIMARNVSVLHQRENVGRLARLLIDTDHGAFPVVRWDSKKECDVLYGSITR